MNQSSKMQGDKSPQLPESPVVYHTLHESSASHAN